MVAAGSTSTVVEREKSFIITAYAAKIEKMAHSRGKSRQILLRPLEIAYFEGKHENTRISYSRATLKVILGKSTRISG
jgi:hypothetical protein